MCAAGKACIVETCLTKTARFGGGRSGSEKDTVRTCNSFS